MSDIDWSKAPEGATHFAPKREDSDMWCAVFWRLENAVGVEAWQVCNDTGQLHHVRWPTWLPETASRLIARPSAWTGEGLPPVGAAVDCMCTAKTKARDWFPAEVKYISPYTVVLTDYSTEELDGEFVAHPATLNFRPRRTPEQIAAEEREKAINEMVAQSPMLDKTWRRKVCQALYDAGYRKQEQPK